MNKSQLKAHVENMINELRESQVEVPEYKINTKTSKGQLETILEELENLTANATHEEPTEELNETQGDSDVELTQEDIDEALENLRVEVGVKSGEIDLESEFGQNFLRTLKANKSRKNKGLRAYRTLVNGEKVWDKKSRVTGAHITVEKLGYANWLNTCVTHNEKAGFTYRDDATTLASRPHTWCIECSEIAHAKGIDFVFVGGDKGEGDDE